MLCYVMLCSDEAATLLDLAQAARSAGDAVMTRLWGYVKEDGGRIDEQIDKFTGDTWYLHYPLVTRVLQGPRPRPRR